MDNVSIKLQEFLDGSLAPADEAELLHRLSVSPERRDLLRSYMRQQAIFNNDRAAITVPYEAEQRLWATLATLPPTVAPIASNLGVATSAAVATSSVFVKIASVALVSIIIGFASGYLFGSYPDNVTSVQRFSTQVLSSPINSNAQVPIVRKGASDVLTINAGARHIVHSEAFQPNRRFPEAPLFDRIVMPGAFFSSDRDGADNAPSKINQISQRIPTVSPLTPGAAFVRDPNGRPMNRPSLGELNEGHKRSTSILDLLELSIHEGIGKQFPNSEATNVSIPILTNTDLSLKFMVMPSFWVGVAGGLANMTHKNLYETADPTTSNNKLEWNYEHRNTAWFGLLAEYRQPISSQFAMTINGGIAASGLGPIMSTELGLRYEVTESVGALVGIRATHATSGVQAQFDALAQPRAGAPGLSNADPSVLADPAMINLEISSGIYFRF